MAISVREPRGRQRHPRGSRGNSRAFLSSSRPPLQFVFSLAVR
jgi:hypothetical protein